MKRVRKAEYTLHYARIFLFLVCLFIVHFLSTSAKAIAYTITIRLADLYISFHVNFPVILPFRFQLQNQLTA